MRTFIAGRPAAGFTLVETILGLAIGLLVVAAAGSFVLAQLDDLRALWVQSRLMHDLRVTAEVVARELRRAGHWNLATAASWQPDGGASAPRNPHAPLAPVAAASDAVRFSYSHDDPADPVAPVGFRLHDGTIEMRLADGHWQALTDSGSVVVIGFTITPQVQRVPLQALCARACADAACAPTQEVRSVTVAIRGRAASHPRLIRSVQHTVRLRNDVVAGACPS